mgnify:CR=1 FL=1
MGNEVSAGIGKRDVTKGHTKAANLGKSSSGGVVASDELHSARLALDPETPSAMESSAPG